MGNQQSQDGPQFCSTTPHPLAARFMVDKAFRVDYVTLKTKNTEVMRIPKQQLVTHRQRVSNTGTEQQIQEEYIDVLVKQPEMLTIEKKNLQDEEEWAYQQAKVNESGIMFQGMYGDVLLLPSGFVVYKDIAGYHYREEYDPKRTQKIFPKGISCAGITKILWFKDLTDRNACFDTMIGDLPPSYDEVMANPEKYNIRDLPPPKWKKGSCNFKVFDGLQGSEVVVYKGNHVKYTDLDGVKHSSNYQKDYIKKCFPQGICFGGLDRTIWLADEAERDRCFLLMQMGGGTEEEKNYPGLYGTVILKKNEVSFTSLVGERIQAAWYDSQSIQRVFPMGISGGGLPHSIWFKEMGDMENCFNAMMQN